MSLSLLQNCWNWNPHRNIHIFLVINVHMCILTKRIYGLWISITGIQIFFTMSWNLLQTFKLRVLDQNNLYHDRWSIQYDTFNNLRLASHRLFNFMFMRDNISWLWSPHGFRTDWDWSKAVPYTPEVHNGRARTPEVRQKQQMST